MKTLIRFFATVAYSGLIPIAPGTIGTLVAMVVYLLLPIEIVSHHYFWILPFVAFFPAVHLASKAEQDMEKDDKRIVIDEFVGYFYAILFLPRTLLTALIALLLFRFFDIIKPEPVNCLQKLPKGWGIMADDVMAGIYANLILQIIYFLFVHAKM